MTQKINFWVAAFWCVPLNGVCQLYSSVWLPYNFMFINELSRKQETLSDISGPVSLIYQFSRGQRRIYFLLR